MFEALPNDEMLLYQGRLKELAGHDLKACACGLREHRQVSACNRNDRGIERNSREPEHADVRPLPRGNAGMRIRTTICTQ